MNIEELTFKPNALYVVRDDDHGVVSRILPEIAKRGHIKGCTFIFLRGDERFEEMSPERLSELGLARIYKISG